MASLLNQEIYTSYLGLLKTEDNGTLVGNANADAINITDGIGTNTEVYISKDRLGIGDATPNKRLEVRDTTTQVQISYDDSNYAIFDVASNGTLTIAPSGVHCKIVGLLLLNNNIILNNAAETTITLDADQNVTLENDLTVRGDATISGNTLTFGNGLIAENESSTVTMLHGTVTNYRFRAPSSANLDIDFEVDAAEDNSDKWRYAFTTAGNFIQNKTTGSYVNLFEIDTVGNVTVRGDLTITGGNVINDITFDDEIIMSDKFTIADSCDVDIRDNFDIITGKALRCGNSSELTMNYTGGHGFLSVSSGTLYLGTTQSGGYVYLGHAVSDVVVNDDLTIIGELRPFANRIQNSSENTVITWGSGADVDTTLAGDLTVTGEGTGESANITIGTSNDGYDRKIVFQHTTLKAVMGIDDSSNKFCINTNTTALNNATAILLIDDPGDVYVKNDLHVGGSLITNQLFSIPWYMSWKTKQFQHTGFIGNYTTGGDSGGNLLNIAGKEWPIMFNMPMGGSMQFNMRRMWDDTGGWGGGRGFEDNGTNWGDNQEYLNHTWLAPCDGELLGIYFRTLACSTTAMGDVIVKVHRWATDIGPNFTFHENPDSVGDARIAKTFLDSSLNENVLDLTYFDISDEGGRTFEKGDMLFFTLTFENNFNSNVTSLDSGLIGNIHMKLDWSDPVAGNLAA